MDGDGKQAFVAPCALEGALRSKQAGPMPPAARGAARLSWVGERDQLALARRLSHHAAYLANALWSGWEPALCSLPA